MTLKGRTATSNCHAKPYTYVVVFITSLYSIPLQRHFFDLVLTLLGLIAPGHFWPKLANWRRFGVNFRQFGSVGAFLHRG